MILDSQQLRAFYEVSQTQHFSRAAEKLGITQSALSQRVQKLEQQLGTTLLVRNHRQVQTTTAGRELLRYLQMQQELEQAAVAAIADQAHQFSGSIRLAGYSSVMRSVVMPALAPLIAEFTQVHLELLTCELRDLEQTLLSGKVDFIITTRRLTRPGLREQWLGREEQVAIEPLQSRSAQYLDHDDDDRTTLAFLKQQKVKTEGLRRSFVGDIYNVIKGVELGIGSAVVSKHLVAKNTSVRIKRYQQRVFDDIYLYELESPFSSQKMDRVRQQLIKSFAENLA